MTKTRLIAVGVIAVAVGAVTAGAVSATTGAPPPKADPGLSTASEHAGFSVPVAESEQSSDSDSSDESSESESSESQSLESPDESTESDSSTDSESSSESSEFESPHPDNHGADVSAVAKSSDTNGRDHGKAVSEAARDNHGHNK